MNSLHRFMRSIKGVTILNSQERAYLAEIIVRVVKNLQADAGEWVHFAQLGAPLAAAGVQYKQYGFPKLRPFLNEFQDVLAFKDVLPAEGKPPVCYVRPKISDDKTSGSESGSQVGSLTETDSKAEKYPSQKMWLYKWAMIPTNKIEELSKLALEEKWYYGERTSPKSNDLPILRNYLAYTFKRLCYEGKIMIGMDKERNEEYAAFNTGLVDKKYECIYALFKKNSQYTNYYWYLLDFVVAGEDIGKTLIKVFSPLPKRANYFENKIQNMLYDTTTGDLSCDYTHIITERTERLPLEFIKEHCSDDFLCIDGVNIDDVYYLESKNPARKAYFVSLGSKIKGTSRVLNRLKNRISNAIDLALKRVEWNYKTAIPMYYPTKNTGSLLLPLSLVDEDHVDLALVVERQPSGAYQGQTILPLDLAYSNSRLVTRPDSDWLKTDILQNEDMDEDVDE